MLFRFLVAALVVLMAGRVSAIVPNAQEQALATLITSASAQGRSTMVYDPILNVVARAKARDLAKRRYFSHVDPDGYGPNRAAQLAGFQLPAYWGTASDSNYIESLSAGRSSASQVYNDWLGSAGHKTHILAESDFYKAQTRYGVGYAYDANSPYKFYWAFISAPPNESVYTALEPYAEWLADRYTPKQIDGAKDADDADGDGIPLLMEFALNFDPTKKQTMTRPQLSTDGQRLEWSLALRTDLGTVKTEVRRCPNLTAWTKTGVTFSNGLYWIPATGAADFLRLSVERSH